MKEKIYFLFRELNSFIDEQDYLNQEKFRTWIEKIFSRVANATGRNIERNRIIINDFTVSE